MPGSALAFHPPVIAHRGASQSAPENTLAALKLARQQGAEWIEFDVKLTQDGVPILMHDDTLNRTTNGTENVAEALWAHIQTLDAGSWFGPSFAGERVPHLAAALRCVLDCGLQPNMEIKPCPGRARATAMIAMIEAAKVWPQDRAPPLVSSFNEEALAIAAQLQPHWPRAFAFEDWDSGWREAATRVKASAFTIDATLLTGEHLPVLKQAGLPVLAYTVNDPVRAKGLLRQGVSAIFCDNPKEMIAAL